MLTMKFLAATFQPGLNMTVRDGPKWAELIVPGAPLMLQGVQPFTGAKGVQQDSHYPAGQGLLLSTAQFDTLKDIPADLLAFNHDPFCREFDGIKAALDASYPNGHGKHGYTVVFFWADYRG